MNAPRRRCIYNVLKCWECEDQVSHKLICGASIENRNGEFVILDVAVDIEYKVNIGTQLMNTVETGMAMNESRK